MRRKREFYGPLPLAAILDHRAEKKISDEELNEMIKGYFILYNNSKGDQKSDSANDFLILTSVFAEVYSSDPIYVLFSWGIIFFREVLAIQTERLSEIWNFSVAKILKSLKKDGYKKVKKFPISCYQILEKLGYFDSDNWLLFSIPDNSELSFHLFHHPIVIQPFPAELIQALKDALTTFQIKPPSNETTATQNISHLSNSIMESDSSNSEEESD